MLLEEDGTGLGGGQKTMFIMKFYLVLFSKIFIQFPQSVPCTYIKLHKDNTKKKRHMKQIVRIVYTKFTEILKYRLTCSSMAMSK